MTFVYKPFGDIITFTRSSPATYFDKDGLMQTAGNNVPRLNFDPLTRTIRGILVEEARTNRYSYSENFFHHTATGRLLIVPTGVIAPNGKGARKLIATTTNEIHYVSLNTGASAAGTTQNFSCIAKAAGLNYLRLDFYAGSNIGGVSFDLTTGAGLITSGTPRYFTKALGDGWWWLATSLDVDAGNSNVLQANIWVHPSPATGSFTGNNVDGVLVTTVQLEQGAFPTSYIASTDSFTSRSTIATYHDASGTIQTAAINAARSAAHFPDANGVFRPVGLYLEQGATNLLVRSEEFDNASWGKSEVTVTADATTAPTGTLVADKLVESSNTATHVLSESFTGSDNTVYVFSCYMKAAERTSGYLRFRIKDGNFPGAKFDLTTGTVVATQGTIAATSMTHAGNGWFRCSVAVNVLAGASQTTAYIYPNDYVSYAGNGTSGIYIWGAQVETGALPSSYIPTTTATVARQADVAASANTTRSADNVNVNTMSPWYNATEGTLLVEYTKDFDGVTSTGITPRAGALNGGATNYISVNSENSAAGAGIVTGGVSQTSFTSGSVVPGSKVKVIVTYRDNDCAMCVNGGGVSTDTTVALFTATTLGIGQRGVNQAHLSGHVRRMVYWPERLTTEDLINFTSG